MVGHIECAVDDRGKGARKGTGGSQTMYVYHTRIIHREYQKLRQIGCSVFCFSTIGHCFRPKNRLPASIMNAAQTFKLKTRN